jgi:flagellar assembly protein FliH
LSSPGSVRILRGSDRSNADAAPFAPKIPSVGSGGHSMAERLEAARSAGYKEGYEAARLELSAGTEAERSERLEKLAHDLARAAADTARAREELLAEAEAEAVQLAFELAESIVQRELVLSESLSSEAIRRAFALVPRGEDLIVRLHPGDVIDVGELSMLVPESSVKVVADPSIEEGGCVVSAGPCQIDAQIGPALERARALISRVGVEPGSAAVSEDPELESSPAPDTVEDSR